MNPQIFAEQLSSIYETDLESVILYGSAADGDFHEGHSDYNIMIVLKELSAIDVAKPNKLIKKWVRKDNPLPLFFSRETIENASDVFPIEFLDIKERHKLLYGDDPFLKMSIDPKNLRHQCEHELRSKLLTLHSRLAVLADKPKELIRLILSSSSSFFAIFSGVLRLAGIKPSGTKSMMIGQLAKLAPLDPTIFIDIVDARKGLRAWKKEEALEKFEQYLTSIEAVVKYTNKGVL